MPKVKRIRFIRDRASSHSKVGEIQLTDGKTIFKKQTFKVIEYWRIESGCDDYGPFDFEDQARDKIKDLFSKPNAPGGVELLKFKRCDWQFESADLHKQSGTEFQIEDQLFIEKPIKR